ncbi:MAG: arylsulfatase [Blastopirellula sp.]|nr:MAG: arylsulfatase [Blastopirellula sp.]
MSICTRLISYSCFLGLIALAHQLLGSEPTTRPNILVIVADDMGWADVGYHGSPIPTPHIDQLCKQSVELDRHYVAPMCTPTRAGLLTGRYWSRFGNHAPSNTRVLPWNTVTLASALQSVGYETYITGKWHLGSKTQWGPKQFGFQHSHGSLAGGVNPWSHLYKQGEYMQTWHRNDQLIEEKGHVTDLVTSEAVKFIEAKREGPFFIYVPYTAVHTPFDETEKYLDLCQLIDTGRRQYAASVAHLDDGVGQMLAALEQTGQRDNTLILFFSDNGGTNGDDSRNYPNTKATTKVQGLNHPLRGWKKQSYEGGIRVPAFVHWKGHLQPKKITAPLHVVDWMPTLCHLVGFEQEEDLAWDGQNIWPVITGKIPGNENRVLYNVGPGGTSVAVHLGDWKLIYNTKKKTSELFHLSVDPYEKTDRAATNKKQLAKLQAIRVQESQKDNSDVPDHSIVIKP